jgi:hypothetical protein
MVYARFYVPNAMDKTKLTERLGDGVIILDGRNRSLTHHAIARRECIRRGCKAYSIHRAHLRDIVKNPHIITVAEA